MALLRIGYMDFRGTGRYNLSTFIQEACSMWLWIITLSLLRVCGITSTVR
jgi:hypothetical protein